MEFLVILLSASLIGLGVHFIAKKSNRTYRDLYEEAKDLNKMKQKRNLANYSQVSRKILD